MDRRILYLIFPAGLVDLRWCRGTETRFDFAFPSENNDRGHTSERVLFVKILKLFVPGRQSL